MARGRRPRSDAAPTRALEVQRAFRERRRKYIADLENTVRELRQENERLRELLALQQPGATQVTGAQLYERPDGPLMANFVDGTAAGDGILNGSTGIPIQVAEILPGDADGRAVERNHDAPAFYQLHAPLAAPSAGSNQRIFRHGLVSFPSALPTGEPGPADHTHLPAPATTSSSLASAHVQQGERAFPSSSFTPARYQPTGQTLPNGSPHSYVRLPRPTTASYVNATGRLVFVPDESTGYPLTLGLSQAMPDGHGDKPSSRLLAPPGQALSPSTQGQTQAQSISSSLHSTQWPNSHSPTGFAAGSTSHGSGLDPRAANSSPAASYPHAHFPPPPDPAPPVPAFPPVSREATADTHTDPTSLSPQHPSASPAFWQPFPSQPQPEFPPSSNSNRSTHHS